MLSCPKRITQSNADIMNLLSLLEHPVLHGGNPIRSLEYLRPKKMA